MNRVDKALWRRRFNSLLNLGCRALLKRAYLKIGRKTLTPDAKYEILQRLFYKVWRSFFLSPWITSLHKGIANCIYFYYTKIWAFFRFLFCRFFKRASQLGISSSLLTFSHCFNTHARQFDGTARKVGGAVFVGLSILSSAICCNVDLYSSTCTCSWLVHYSANNHEQLNSYEQLDTIIIRGSHLVCKGSFLWFPSKSIKNK